MPSSTQAAYQIGDAGTVTLDTAGEVLSIVSASPNPGWVVEKAESDGSLAIEVELRSGATVVEFEANLLFGVVSTSVEVKTDGNTGSGPSTSIDDDGAPSTSVDDDGGPSTTIDDGGAPSSSIDDGDNSGSGRGSSGSGSSGSGSSGSGGGDDD